MNNESTGEDNKKTIAIWFSCGAASAVAAKLTIDRYKDTHIIRLLNNPIMEEDPDNLRFLSDVEKWVGVDVEFVTHPKYPSNSCVDVWNDVKAMSFPHGAPCTRILKKEARQIWERKNKVDWHVLGFTLDELKRHKRFTTGERSNVIPVLINAGMTKNDCYAFLNKHGIELPAIYKRGYPNANCIGCVKATSPTYWNLVRKEDPEVFSDRAKQSRKLGVRLAMVKGERIFLDELSEHARGRPLKSMDFECGLFCEEKW